MEQIENISKYFSSPFFMTLLIDPILVDENKWNKIKTFFICLKTAFNVPMKR